MSGLADDTRDLAKSNRAYARQAQASEIVTDLHVQPGSPPAFELANFLLSERLVKEPRTPNPQMQGAEESRKGNITIYYFPRRARGKGMMIS